MVSLHFTQKILRLVTVCASILTINAFGDQRRCREHVESRILGHTPTLKVAQILDGNEKRLGSGQKKYGLFVCCLQSHQK